LRKDLQNARANKFIWQWIIYPLIGWPSNLTI
jgi:hypothetical protein